MKDRPPRRPTVWSRLAQVRGAATGYDLAANVLVGLGLGWLAQRFLGAPDPWGIVCGIVLGSVSGFYQLFKAPAALNKPKAPADDDGQEGGHA